MKNEKVPLLIAVVSGATAFVLHEMNVSSLSIVLIVVTAVSAVIYIEHKWHNIHQAEINSHKEALRDYQRKALGEMEGKEKKED